MIREAGITFWSDDGATVAFEHSRELVDRARPQYAQLHSDPVSLATRGPALTKAVRTAYPDMLTPWAIAGDAYMPDPRDEWVRAAKACVDSGVRVLMFDCELAWKSSKLGDLAARVALARRCIEAVHLAAPSLELWFNSYAAPVSVLRDPKNPKGKRFGGHGSFPWAGFLADGLVSEVHLQVYAAPKKGVAAVGWLPEIDGYNTRSMDAAVAKKWIHPGTRRGIYLQAHHVPLRDTCAVGERYDRTSLWASHTRIDTDGARALCVLSELARRKQTIRELQASAGLKADGIVGPLTLAALGIK